MIASLSSEMPDQSLFENAFNHASIGMALVGLDGRWIKVNPATCRLLGYSAEELLALDFQTLTHPEDLEADLDFVGQLLEGKITSYCMEKRYFSKAGSVVWVLLSVSLVRQENGEPLHFISQLQNITPLKEREMQLQEAQRQLEETNSLLNGILTGTQDLVAALDHDLRYTAFNEAYAREVKTIFGREVHIGDTVPQILSDLPEQRERAIGLWKRALQGENFRLTAEFGDPSRERRHYELQYNSVRNSRGEIIGASHIVRDVTDRNLLEEKLRQSERRFRAIFNNTFQFSGLLSPDGTVLEINQTALRFAGLSSMDVIGKPFWETHWWSLSEESRDCLRNAIRDAAKGQFVRYETQIRGSGDEIAIVDFSLKPVRDEKNQIVLLIPESRDITERRRIEAAQRESEQVLRTFFQSAPLIMGMVDLCPERPEDIFFVSINWRAAALYDSTPEALACRWASEVGATEERCRFWIEKYKQSRLTGQPVQFEYSRPSGAEVRWYLCSVSHIGPSGEDRQRYCYVISDITTRKNYEAQIEQQRVLLADANAKLEALAVTDALTGVKNRRAFVNALMQERERAGRTGVPFSLVMLDVDNFKAYNDTYGHLAGDGVLQNLVRILNDTVRPTDFVARFGGEEFAIILHATDAEGGAVAAERCRAAVAHESWPHRKVTVSLGVATYADGMSEDNLIDAADAALYAAKLAGKNCVRSTELLG